MAGALCKPAAGGKLMQQQRPLRVVERFEQRDGTLQGLYLFVGHGRLLSRSGQGTHRRSAAKLSVLECCLSIAHTAARRQG